MTAHPHEIAAATPAPSLRRRLGGACLECGEVIPPGKQALAEFCCNACRKTWNNRRMKRGAELHDLYMAHRFDRAEAKDLGVLQAMNRMVANWREEDRRKRNSRRSWRKPAVVLEERPYLKVHVSKLRSGK